MNEEKDEEKISLNVVDIDDFLSWKSPRERKQESYERNRAQQEAWKYRM
jgi:hypothetical protein